MNARLLIVSIILTNGTTFLYSDERKPTDNTIHNLLWAAYKPEEAQPFYDQLLSAQNVQPQVYKGYVPYLRQKKQYHEILKLLPTLDKHFLNEPCVQMAVIEALERTGQQKYAIERLARLHTALPDHAESALLLSQVHLNNRDPNNALGVINTFLANTQNKQNTFIFHFIKAQIYLQMNNKEDALAAIEQCLAAHRNFEKGWLLYALLEEAMGNIEKAIKGYTTFLDIIGNDTSVQNRLIQLLFKQKMLSEQTTSMNVSLPCLQKAILLFEHNKPKEALKQVEECLKTHPKDTDARILKVQIHAALGECHQAFTSLQAWMLEEPTCEEWYKTAALLYKKSNIKKQEYISALTTIEKKYPHELLPMLYLADAYLRTQKPQKAITYLKKVIASSNDHSIQAKACYQIGRMYYQQQRYDKMVAICQKGLQYQKDFAPTCNMLAYYFGSKGNNKKRAQELVQQIILQEPNNPHYQHTAAYLAYKQGNYQEALKIIQPLALREPNDTFIEKHYRKINAKLAQQKNVAA